MTGTATATAARHPRHLPRFAPIVLPLRRRLQTAAVLFFVVMVPLCALIALTFLVVPVLWPISIAYLVWMVTDIKAPLTGGRRSEFFRKLSIWKLFQEYFPIDLVKDCELDPSRNYIFATHPHGILSLGALANFGTEANSVSERLPGIDLRMMTLASNFRIPIVRDILMALGLCDVSKGSCEYLLNHGKSIVIIVGGASEALDAHPKTYDLTLKRRKGFVRLALATGASLVPVLSFGENDIWSQVSNPIGSKLRSIQIWLQHRMGFSTPVLFGRGVFNYDFGILPRRERIVTVIGTPILVEKNETPTEEVVTALAEEYIKHLTDLFVKYAPAYAPDAKKPLTIVS